MTDTVCNHHPDLNCTRRTIRNARILPTPGILSAGPSQNWGITPTGLRLKPLKPCFLHATNDSTKILSVDGFFFKLPE